MNFTLFPYFFATSTIVGSSCLHSGHHVAQNSMSIGVLPTYCPMSNDFPSRVSTMVDVGALAPTGSPVSCAWRAGAGNGEPGTESIGAIATAPTAASTSQGRRLSRWLMADGSWLVI